MKTMIGTGILVAAVAFAAGPAARAADAAHPYSSVNKQVDAGNDTGDSQTDQLNAQELQKVAPGSGSQYGRSQYGNASQYGSQSGNRSQYGNRGQYAQTGQSANGYDGRAEGARGGPPPYGYAPPPYGYAYPPYAYAPYAYPPPVYAIAPRPYFWRPWWRARFWGAPYGYYRW